MHGYALATAREYGVPEPDLRDLAHGVLLHDIGKIGIPDAILLKPGPLTPEEWKIMRTHPEIGKRLIENIPFLRGAVPIVYSPPREVGRHRLPARPYGRGDPARRAHLRGGRRLRRHDLRSPVLARPSPSTPPSAEIKRCAGAHFDPSVVEAFLRVPEPLLEDIRRRSTEPVTA